MDILFKSHGALNNSKTEIKIRIFPFDKNSDEYKFISNQTNDIQYSEIKSLIKNRASITIKDGIGDEEGKEKNIIMSDAEEAEIIRLIKGINISNFVDDIGSICCCDGGSFHLQMKGAGWSLELSSGNAFHSALPHGLSALISKIKEMSKNRSA